MMHLKVISPEKFLYEGDVVLVQLPGAMGSFQILRSHAPMIAELEKGKMRIIDDTRNKFMLEINDGIVEVKDNIIVVLTK